MRCHSLAITEFCRPVAAGGTSLVRPWRSHERKIMTSESEGDPPILPICLTIDVSASMEENGAIKALNDALPELKQMVIDEPLVAEVARIGIVIFNHDADQLIPLTDLTEVDIEPLEAVGGTSYKAALSETRAFLEQSIRALGPGVRFYTPIVFFLTDGYPLDDEAEWVPEAVALRTGKYKANVVCFGFADANAEILTKIGRTFLWRNANPMMAVKEIFKTLIGSIKTTSMSAKSSSGPMIQFPESVKEDAELFMEMDLNQV